MSQWTHIIGTIVGTMAPTKSNERKLNKILGRQLAFPWDRVKNRKFQELIDGKWVDENSKEHSDFEKDWHDSFDRRTHRLPMGSEGSIRYSIHKEEEQYGYAYKYVISVWGDLRDYGECDEDLEFILNWIKGILWNYGEDPIESMTAISEKSIEDFYAKSDTPINVEESLFRIRREGYPSIIVHSSGCRADILHDGFVEYARHAILDGKLAIRLKDKDKDTFSKATLHDMCLTADKITGEWLISGKDSYNRKLSLSEAGIYHEWFPK